MSNEWSNDGSRGSSREMRLPLKSCWITVPSILSVLTRFCERFGAVSSHSAPKWIRSYGTELYGSLARRFGLKRFVLHRLLSSPRSRFLLVLRFLAKFRKLGRDSTPTRGGKKGNLQALPFEVAFLRGQLVDFSWLSLLIDWGSMSSFITDISMEY